MIKTKNTKDHFLAYMDIKHEALLDTLRQTCKKIAPVWPLENFVAVNPYLGMADKTFDQVANDLMTLGGIQMTLPISFYLQKIEEGSITTKALTEALSRKHRDTNVDAFIETLEQFKNADIPKPLISTVSDVLTTLTQKDWNRFITARISSWAASYFDNGQATWSAADKHQSIYASWKAEASIDRTPEITGLKGFRVAVKKLPETPLDAIQESLDTLGIPKEATSTYLHRLLLRVGGWSAYAARLDWDNNLYGEKDGELIEFLAVLISWEACVFQCMSTAQLQEKWAQAKTEISLLSTKTTYNELLTVKLILQDAFDLSAQRALVDQFQQVKSTNQKKDRRVKAQAIFCIDVRSEVYRRNLELVDHEIETIGFAGFFAFPIKYVPLAHEEGAANCPVLLTTGPTILEELTDAEEHEKAVNSRRVTQQVKSLWKSFKTGAVSCFSFVSPVGLSYLPKLFTDSFGFTRPVGDPNKVGITKELDKKRTISLADGAHNQETVGIPFDQQVQMGKNALKAMSLTEDFGKFVLIVGHGATTVNNPHATGLDCGACGGHSGEANAKVAAAVLNNQLVRESLTADGIQIPDDTTFLACLHDTTTDEVTIYNGHEVPTHQSKELAELEASLKMAGHTSRTERALRMSSTGSSNVDRSVIGRSKDWSQVRPEWGLAGCSAFVVAPRERTKGLSFNGKSFLHSYDWEKDQGFSILELIMTAPMVVTSWINLQYYASTVDNKNYGSGNKTLHNVTGGVGVLEGYSGDLRVGLPMQSVHDGEKYQHEPLKLNVIIEAPIEAMTIILEKHQSVRDLCDNGWIHLLALNDEGHISHRYQGDLKWEKMTSALVDA